MPPTVASTRNSSDERSTDRTREPPVPAPLPRRSTGRANNPFLVTQLEAAVSIHNAAEYLEDRERRHARDLKQATLPEGYTLLRGEEHPGYEHGWTAPNGKRYGFWVSRETAREEAWNHRDTPNEFDDPGQLD